MNIVELKLELLRYFHEELRSVATEIAPRPLSPQKKAQTINSLCGALRTKLSERVRALPISERPNYSLVLQYCYSVASLEYRHCVWPYEYMSFSRRVGELWEAFCSAAWDYPSRVGVTRIQPPDFRTVRKVLLNRIQTNVGNHDKRKEIFEDIDTLFEIIGDINMYEDEVFTVDGLPHVIDFKSGFGSNEKGNMLRLQTVGNAYRIWNHNTRLLLLVRQEQNNNYLRVLRRLGLWEVHTGDQAYKQVSAFTGADFDSVRATVINWKADLSSELYQYLNNANLISYLTW